MSAPTRYLLVHGLAQAEYAMRLAPEVARSTTIVTTDLAAATALEAARQPFVDAWKYLDEQTLERHWHLSFELSERWWGDAPPLVHRGVDVTAAAIGEWRLTLENALNARAIFERLLEERVPEAVSACLEPDVPVCRHGPPPLARAMHTVAVAVLRWLLEQRSIPFVPLPEAPDLWRAKPRKRTRTSAGAFVSGVEHVVEHVDDRTALLLDLGQNPKDLVGIERAFRRLPGWRVERFSELTRPGYPGWLGLDDALRGTLARGLEAMLAARRRYVGPHAAVLGNQHLDFQFRRIWDELAAAIVSGDAVDAIVEASQPSIVVLGVDNFTVERFVMGRVRARGVPVAVMLHGGLGPSRGFRELASQADCVLVWGQEDVETLSRYGTAVERMCAVGSLRYDDRWQNLGALRSRRPGVQAARAALRLPPQKPVVAVLGAAISLGLGVPIADATRHRHALAALLDVVRSHPELTFFLKPHPSYDHFELYEALSSRGLQNLVYERDIELADLLPACDAAIIINQCTTAALEAALHEVPVIFVQNAIYGLAEWQRSSLSDHGAVHVVDLAELEPTLDRVLRDDQLRLELLGDSRQFLRHKLGPQGAAPAAERVAAALAQRAGPAPSPSALGRFFTRLRVTPTGVTSADWRAFVAAVAAGDSRTRATQLLGVVHALGTAVKSPTRLSGAVSELADLLREFGFPAGTVEQVTLSCFLSAMIDATNRGDWPRVTSAFTSMVGAAPGLVSHPLALRLVGKALAASSEVAASAAGLFERGRDAIGQLTRGRR